MEAVPWLIGSKTLRDLAMMLAHRMKKSPRYGRKTTKVCGKKKYTAARKQVVPLPEGHHHNRENIKRKRETGDDG